MYLKNRSPWAPVTTCLISCHFRVWGLFHRSPSHLRPPLDRASFNKQIICASHLPHRPTQLHQLRQPSSFQITTTLTNEPLIQTTWFILSWSLRHQRNQPWFRQPSKWLLSLPAISKPPASAGPISKLVSSFYSLSTLRTNTMKILLQLRPQDESMLATWWGILHPNAKSF